MINGALLRGAAGAQAATPATYAGYLVDALRRYPDRVAFDDLSQEFTYRYCSDSIARITAALVRRFGPIRRRGFAALCPNSVDGWLAVSAVKLAGGHALQLSTRASPNDIAFNLADANIEVLFVHEDLTELAAAAVALAGAELHILGIGSDELGPDLIALAAAEGACRLDPAEDLEPEDVAEVKYTGGSTGTPKGAVHSHRSLLAQALAYLSGVQIPHGARYLASAPMSHSGYVFIAPVLYGGGRVIINHGFEVDLFLDTVERKRANFVMAVPTMIYRLLDEAARRKVDFSSIERFIYGAAPMNVARLQEAHDRMGQVFTQIYGVVECLGIGLTLTAGMHDLSRPDRLASCGLPFPGTRAALLDDAGDPVERGAAGEVCLRTPAMMSGYLNNPEETARAFSGGWLHTGDLAIEDEDGLYTIVDRKKDVIVSGGFNVYSAEVESVIARDPRVSGVAVIGVPDDVWGEAVKAIVVKQPGADLCEREIQGLVRGQKGPVQAPKSVEFVDALPLTAIGKIDKRALREPHWQGKARRIN